MTAAVTQTVRYCRIRKTYKSSHLMIEMGLHVAGSATEQMWRTIRDFTVVLEKSGQTKVGLARKTNVERRIQARLKSLGVWKDRSGEEE